VNRKPWCSAHMVLIEQRTQHNRHDNRVARNPVQRSDEARARHIHDTWSCVQMTLPVEGCCAGLAITLRRRRIVLIKMASFQRIGQDIRVIV
jgi:hypothetical protein